MKRKMTPVKSPDCCFSDFTRRKPERRFTRKSSFRPGKRAPALGFRSDRVNSGKQAEKRQRPGAVQDASRVREPPVQTSASFWTAPVLWRFGSADSVHSHASIGTCR